MSEPLDRLPGEITVSLVEISTVITELEGLLADLARDPELSWPASRVDDVIGRMTRWVWPVLRDLDEEGEG